MNDIRYATEMSTSYENFYSRCPWCKHENVFNRVSDLEDVEPIAYKEVRCQKCEKPFAINNDSVNSAHEMLIFDCYRLKQEKRYIYCILNLAQAFEVFFSLYLRVHFLYRPFAQGEQKNPDIDSLDRLNDLASMLYETTKGYTFARLRNVFLNCVLKNQNVASLDEAEPIINSLPKLTRVPSDQSIKACVNQEQNLAALLKSVKDSKIRELRNKVVHQRAYRPTLAEVNAALEETRSIIFPLSRLLKVEGDDIDWYRRRA